MGHLPRHRHLGRHGDDRDRSGAGRPLRPGNTGADTHAAGRKGVHGRGAGGDRGRDPHQLPGYLGSYGGEGTDGHVFGDVFYDDGSLQEWADTTYGENVVIVSSALVDAG